MKNLFVTFAILIVTLFIPACSTTQQAAFQAQVTKATVWTSSPQGTAILNDVVAGVNAYVAVSGGTKSKANAANIATAARSLETGSLPSLATISNAVSTYTGSTNGLSQVATAIAAAAASAPTPTGGLEVAAQQLDAISASTIPASGS